MRSVNFSDESGSVLVEFIVMGLLLQLLLLAGGLTLIETQHQQLAAESLARHSLRSFLLHGTPIEVTAKDLAEQFRLSTGYEVSLDCQGNCEQSGDIAALTVRVGGTSARVFMAVP